MKLVVLGLSITSSWGNGHATTYRALIREFAARGHEVLFLERDVPWYTDNRDLTDYPHAQIRLYRNCVELRTEFGAAIREADAVIVGSYVPEGVQIGEWVIEEARGVTAFYDIDTPVTLAKLGRGEHEYLSPDLIRRYELYLSFTGGPTLQRLENEFGSPCARPLYCAVDPQVYRPAPVEKKWELGYLGTYSPDRQPTLNALLVDVARHAPEQRFIVAGPQYPRQIAWPGNVTRVEHLPPSDHRMFYNAQRFTLNVTRADMAAAGWSPSVRLFEAAACGTPIVSDAWNGLEAFFAIGREILVARSTAEMEEHLRTVDADAAAAIGAAARKRVLREHTAAHRAAELESYLEEVATERPTSLTA